MEVARFTKTLTKVLQFPNTKEISVVSFVNERNKLLAQKNELLTRDKRALALL